MISGAAKQLAAERIALIEIQFRQRTATDLEAKERLSFDHRSGSRVAAILMDLESQSRKALSPLSPAEVRSVADRLVGLEWRAVQAEVAFGRLRGRRMVRVGEVLARWMRRPWRLGFLVGGLGGAMAKRVLPELPDPPSAEGFRAELDQFSSAVKPRRLPYPHLRVAHAGRITMFEMVAPHFRLGEFDLEKELKIGFDMLLIEPGVDDPLEDVDPDLLDHFREAEIPVLYVARTMTHLTSRHLSRADLIIAEDPDIARRAEDQGHTVLRIHPSVDDTIHNPIGWKQHPHSTLLVIADHPGIEDHLETIAPHAEHTHLYGAEIPGFTPAQHTPDRPVTANQNQTAKQHIAAYTTPQLTATPTSHHQLVLELTAAGLPVITPPDPTLTHLLNHHHLTATTPEELADHVQTLQHPPSRERHSIPNRRHVLTNHTRRHRFEQLLTHLDIPTNPTPRISILLATKRPDYIEHALTNITNQNWPHKELLLILHGAENFDLDHIETLTNQLPYPTKTITCPTTWTLGDCLNAGLDQATGTYITKMDDDDHYGPNHLTDLTTAHTYSNADITGKLASIVHLKEFGVTLNNDVLDAERFHHHVAGPTMTALGETIRAYGFLRKRRRVDTTLLERVIASDGTVFLTHSYGFILERRESGHTWQVEGYRQFRNEAVESGPGVPAMFLERE